MNQQEQLQRAMEVLKQFIIRLSVDAELTEEYGAALWEKIKKSQGILTEVSYFHDFGEFYCKYQVAGYTLADILVWQVDHFKAFLDRPTEMNRYRKEKLFLTAIDIMLQMEENPEAYAEKMSMETGTDFIIK